MAELEESPADSIVINVKSTKEKMEIKISPSKSVKELKVILREKLGPDVKGELCLIFSGKILKDEESLESHGIVKDGLTLHLVLRAPKATPTASSTTAAASTSSSQGSSTTTANNTTSSGTPPTINPFGMMSGMPPQGDMQAQMQQLFSNPEVLQQLLNSPMMQNLISNPEAFQSLFTSNPQIQQMMERNPEISHILNNPDLMRQALEMARNPGAMREMMRSQDRQLSNIESLPGGFNALARMYSEIQEPMMDAANESIQQQVQNNPFAALFSGPQQNAPQPGPSVPQGTANTAPLPNPWGSSPSSSNPSSRSGQTSNQSSSNNSGSSGSGSTGSGASGSPGFGPQTAEMMRLLSANPNMFGQLGSGQFQGMSPMQMLQDPAYRQMMQQMMQSPEYRQAMIELMSNPQAMQAMMQSVPGMQNMLGGQDLTQVTERTAQMMNNPQMVELLSNPEAMQGYMTMMQGFNQMQQSMPGAGSLFGQMPPPTSTTSTGTTGSTGGTSTTGGNGTTGGEGGGGASVPPPNNQAFLQMMQQMQQMMGGGQMGGVGNSGGQSTGPPGGGSGQPETQQQAAARRYRIQLETLQRMGFPDRAANIQALIDSGGDLNSAIDKLIKF